MDPQDKQNLFELLTILIIGAMVFILATISDCKNDPELTVERGRVEVQNGE